jgi:uncharacterized protein YaeQ
MEILSAVLEKPECHSDTSPAHPVAEDFAYTAAFAQQHVFAMALKSTVFKAELQVSDLDRHYYHSHQLTIARHPSENDARMMVRLVAFALHADPALEFTKGLSTQDEPDLWRKTLSGDIALWIDIGQPDEKRLRKAAGRAAQVVVYSYSGRSAVEWWEQMRGKLGRFGNVAVVDLPAEQIAALDTLVQRSMRLQCTIQDGELWLGDTVNTVHLTPCVRKQLQD